MASNRSAASYIATSGGSLTALTTAGYFVGAFLYASGAAATLTIKDGTGQIISWSGAAAAVANIAPALPIALTSGLSVTNSGAGTYVVFYAARV